MIENTSQRDAMIHLLGSMSEGSDGYIRGMEAAGQRQLVNSTSFPTEAPIAALEALGFVFGPVDSGDPMFRPAQLPAGWRKEGSDHDMWSYVLDEKGRKRVSIFYKAAFYDRRAHASLVHPTAPLSELIYGDAEPTSIELDELLTADVAREYLKGELASSTRALESYARDDEHYEARDRRLRSLLAMLPDE